MSTTLLSAAQSSATPSGKPSADVKSVGHYLRTASSWMRIPTRSSESELYLPGDATSERYYCLHIAFTRRQLAAEDARLPGLFDHLFTLTNGAPIRGRAVTINQQYWYASSFILPPSAQMSPAITLDRTVVQIHDVTVLPENRVSVSYLHAELSAGVDGTQYVVGVHQSQGQWCPHWLDASFPDWQARYHAGVRAGMNPHDVASLMFSSASEELGVDPRTYFGPAINH